MDGNVARVSKHNLRLHSSRILGVAMREKLGNTKEVTLRLSVSVVRFSWVGKHCKHHLG